MNFNASPWGPGPAHPDFQSQDDLPPLLVLLVVIVVAIDEYDPPFSSIQELRASPTESTAEATAQSESEAYPELEPLAPAEAIDLYLEHRRDDTRTATRRKFESALKAFQEWTVVAEIDNLNALRPRDLLRFKSWRKQETSVNTVSLNANLAILRRFLRFCEMVEAVQPDLHESVPLPNVPKDEQVSDDVPPDGQVDSMRAYLREFEYASRPHAMNELIAEIGLRMGAVRAIDLGDIDLSDRRIHLRHRPEGPDVDGTPLKNGVDGERLVNLSDRLMETVQDYIDNRRHDVTDEFGREALFTTGNGRVTTATIRRDFYKYSRPCIHAKECPHDREIESCEARQHTNAVHCPSSFSTHPLRKWSIMRQLDAGMSKERLSDRADVSVPVLEQHYDHRSEERKSDRRREELERHLPEYDSEADE